MNSSQRIKEEISASRDHEMKSGVALQKLCSE